MESEENKQNKAGKPSVWWKTLYYHAPSFMQGVLAPARLIYKFLNNVRLEQWILTGKEIASGQELSILYSGTEECKNYFASLAFGNLFTAKNIGRKWIWQIYTKRKHPENNWDLAITEVSANIPLVLKKNDRCFRIPYWVNFDVNIPDDIASFVDYRNLKSVVLVGNTSLKSDLNKIKKNKLCYEVTHDESRLQSFYHDMYLPYLVKVHGNRGIIHSYKTLLSIFKYCSLILLKKETTMIGGILVKHRKKQASLHSLGISSENMESVQEAAISALYLFSLCYLKEKGYEIAHLGGTRAFLKDGVLAYKKKWRPRIGSVDKKHFLFNVVSTTEGVKGFLINNPFIYLDKQKLMAAIFWDDKEPLSEQLYNTIHKTYYCDGIAKWRVYRFWENGHWTEINAPEKFV